jgi:hypothetical protein
LWIYERARCVQQEKYAKTAEAQEGEPTGDREKERYLGVLAQNVVLDIEVG